MTERPAPSPSVAGCLLGEDRLFGGNALFVDLVPQSCWFSSVRSCLAPQDWRRLSLEVRQRAGNRCEVCGAPEDRARKVYLEAHERWAFDEVTRTQKLMRIIALCRSCHEVTHWGLTRIKGRERRAIAHLHAVTGWTEAQMRAHVREAFRVWSLRSRFAWSLDISLITDNGMTVVPPPPAVPRKR